MTTNLLKTELDSLTIKPTGAENVLYFYIGDHLGSSAWVTDKSGNALQHLTYLPFGETFIDQKATGSSFDATYKHSGKPLDLESGFYNYGKRMYNPALGIWLSVDPAASKYPHESSYAFCSNNPIMLYDEDGRWGKPTHHKMIARAVNELRQDGVLNINDKQAKSMIRGMQKGSNIADGFLNGNQSTANSHIHYMRDPSIDSQTAKDNAHGFVNDRISDFQNSGNKDYESLGQAAHTMMDMNCPTHTTQNPDGSYEPIFNNLPSPIDLMLETFNPTSTCSEGLTKILRHRDGDMTPTDNQMNEGVGNVKNVIIRGLGLDKNNNQRQGQGKGLIDP